MSNTQPILENLTVSPDFAAFAANKEALELVSSIGQFTQWAVYKSGEDVEALENVQDFLSDLRFLVEKKAKELKILRQMERLD